jgi:hypothetical protein
MLRDEYGSAARLASLRQHAPERRQLPPISTMAGAGWLALANETRLLDYRRAWISARFGCAQPVQLQVRP